MTLHTLSKHILAAGTLCLGFAALASCSNDDDKYTSLPPTLSDITVVDLETGSTTLRAGRLLLATAKQHTRGHLLYKATYSWTPDGDGNFSHRYVKGVVYDQEPADPVDTLIVSKAGTYTLQFKATYAISGKGNGYYDSGKFEGGGSYTTGGGALSFILTATKPITVLPAAE